VVRSSRQFTQEYVLQPGDQISVSVFQVPELNTTVTVRADGYVSLPILKDVKAAGLSVPALDAVLDERFAERLNHPNTTVTVLNPRQASVYVMGEVVRPAPVPVRDAPNVALAIAAAGGVARTAALDNVAVIRLDAEGHLVGTIIPRPTTGETAFYMAMASIPLQAGDLVIVPESGRSQFVRFVQDFVNTPTSSLSQVLTPYVQYEDLLLLNKLTK
jgi:polysaccharide export outer membrane protein